MTQKIISTTEQETRESDYLKLPDLYIRKIRVLERLTSIRQGYLPPENSLTLAVNTINKKKYSQWDFVIEEVKNIAFDMREERKYKITLAYLCSRRIMKTLKLENVRKKELSLYHKLISSEMANFIRQDFTSIQDEKTEIEQNEENKMEYEDLLLVRDPITDIEPFDTKIPKKIEKICSKMKKKPGNNYLKINRKPTLLNYMNNSIKLFGTQNIEECCKIDKMATWENLAKLFKRFPKKNKNLKSNVPDIFTQFIGNPTSPKDEKTTENKKKKKLVLMKEESKSVTNEWGRGEFMAHFKKNKNSENIEEILTLYYNDHKIGDGDYQKLFGSSIENSNFFPKTWDDVQNVNFYEKLNEKEWIYKEKTFDDYYENFDEKYKIKIEKFISSLDERMKNYFSHNKQFFNYDIAYQKKIADKEEINLKDLVFSYSSITKNYLIILQKSKFRLFKELQIQPPKQLDYYVFLETHLNFEWSIGLTFLLNYYVNIYGTKWDLISDALNINFFAKNFLISEEVSERKWMSFISRTTTHKILDINSKIYPSKKAFFSLKIETEKEKPQQKKFRKTHYKKTIFSYKFNEMLIFFKEKFPLVKPDDFYRIYPKEKALSIMDNINSGKVNKGNKEIEEFFKIDADPSYSINVGGDNKFNIPSYESPVFDSLKGKRFPNNNANIMLSRRKKYNAEKMIPSLGKLLLESKQRQYSHPPPQNGSIQQPPPGYMPMNYSKMPMSGPPNPMMRPSPYENPPNPYESVPNNYSVNQSNIMNLPPQMLQMRGPPPMSNPNLNAERMNFAAAQNFQNNKTNMIRNNVARPIDQNMIHNGVLNNNISRENMANRNINVRISTNNFNGNPNAVGALFRLNNINTVNGLEPGRLKPDQKNTKKTKN